MKSGQLFWGFFLLCIGALFLSVKYDVITNDFGFIWDVWPLIFILWGAMVIFKNEYVRPILSALLGVFLGLILFGIVYNLFAFSDWSPNIEFESSHEVYNETMNPEIKYANFDFQSGAGIFVIKDKTSNLIDGESYGNLADYDFTVDQTDSNAYINFDYAKKHVKFFNGRIKNKVELSLNENPVWDFDFDFGAAKAKFDLSQYKVKDIQINTGAANVWMKLGNKYDNTNVDIQMGAASIDIEVPQSSGCRLYGDMVFVSKNIKGFDKKESGYYETSNYENAKDKIEIKVDGGVSSLKVERY